jgi:hypothetical protein
MLRYRNSEELRALSKEQKNIREVEEEAKSISLEIRAREEKIISINFRLRLKISPKTRAG